MIAVWSCGPCSLLLLERHDRCPSCGGDLLEGSREGAATVLAATELLVAPEGWSAPHRLVLFELDGGGRSLAVAEDPLPAPGGRGRVELGQEGRFLWKRVPSAPSL